jgi:hypothetical protein
MIMKKITYLLLIILFTFSGQIYSQNGDEITVENIGGTDYVIHKFTSIGPANFTPPAGITEVDLLVVAGGGGGAGNTAYSGAGGGAGGAGGLIFKEGYTVTPGSAISLNVGVGGNGRNGLNTPADNGEATLFDGLTALGGGGGNITPGGETTNSPAADGGSGGGGRQNLAGSGLQPTSTDGGFGNDGARNSTDNGGGGGGGAGSQPANITGNDGGDGGDGLDYSAFFGPSVGDAGFFAGGGGGGGDDVGAQGLGGQGGGGDGSSAIPSNLIAPSIGMANTGGGGGGGGSVHAGAAGGSGIVIIRYKLSDVDGFVFINDGNWNDNTKWENNTPPTTGANVVILANPQVTTDQTVGNIDILSTGIIVNIDNNVNLNVKGNINSLGQFTGDGEVVLNGSAAQTISGGGSFENLRINATSVDFNDPSDLFGVLYVDQGTLNTNGNLSLRCAFGTPPKTAQVGQVASGSSINGDVTVEQCFPARRAFRLLTSSVTTTGSIRQNWQDNPISYTDVPRPDPDSMNPNTSGYGTHITGVSPGAANATLDQDGDNGFDYNPSGNASMFTYDNIAQDWNPVANTTDNLIAGTPYRLMIRGDRSINIEQNNTSPTNTRLSATGTLIVGSYTPTTLLFTNVDNDFNFIANPYHAQVDIRELINNSLNLKDMEYYVWDPTLNTRGGYATVDLNTNNSPAGDANVYLQPMQAAFVRTGASGSAPVVNFEESHKDISQAQTTTKSLSQPEYINIQLYNADSYTEGNTPSDGLRINFDKSFSATSEDDSPKLGNLDENLARIEGNTYSAIERRPFPETEERLELFINQYRREAYVMKFNLTDNLNTKVFIEDKYLNETQEITTAAYTYTFTVDESISESTASDRFSLVFEPISLSTVEEALVEASLYPNPTKGSFRISGANLGEDAKIEIYNMIGQQVYKTDLKNQSTTEITNFNGSAGVYLVKLKTNQGERTFKLIKQ